MFAAPVDLGNASGSRMCDRYDKVVMRVAFLKDWYGFNGSNYSRARDLYKALKRGRYHGEWFIPPKELLRGYTNTGKTTVPDNLYEKKDVASFKGSLCTQAIQGRDDSLPYFYWSSTEARDEKEYIAVVRIIDGSVDWRKKDENSHSCRPMRAVLISG